MADAEIKKDRCSFGLPYLAAAWIVLFCLAVGSMPLYAGHSSVSTDEVYCPLQKNWVKKSFSYSESVAPKKTLDGICSSAEHKSSFIFALSNDIFAKQKPLNAPQTQELFFGYLEKGKRAFAEITLPKDSPERHLTKLSVQRKSGNANFKMDFAGETIETSGFKHLARPPNFLQSVKFDFQFVRELKQISRHINPRSPPAFI